MSPREPFWRRYRRFLGPDPRADVDDELAFHLEELRREFEARGVPPMEADRRARARFGDVAAARRALHARSTRRRRRAARGEWWCGFTGDVRFAVRRLRREPGFSVAAIAMLALCVGGSTAIFSVVDAVVLRALPYDASDRLVQVGTIDTRTGAFNTYQSPQDFADWQARQDRFVAMTATTLAGGFRVDQDGVPRDLLALRVTAGYFDVFRAYPQLGRAFTEAHEFEAGRHVALISDGLWRRQYGADSSVIGRTLRSTAELTYGAPFPVPAGTWTIIGVMPRGFQSPVRGARQADVWVPYVVPEDQRTRDGSPNAHLQVAARLADGVGVEEADLQIRAITAGLADAHPDWFGDAIGSVRSLHEAIVGSVRTWMMVLLGAVGLVLLIACVNVANLMLARATARDREIQTRVALGASRWQIARGLLVENLVLWTVGAVLALLVASWGIAVFRATLPEALPRISTVALDLRVLGVTALVVAVTGLLFGFAPALRLSRPDAGFVVRDGGRGTTTRRVRLRSILVVTEIAMAVMLTIGAGLFLSSFVRVATVDLGLDPHNVLTMRVWPRFDSSKPGWAEEAIARSATAVPEILDRVSSIPGVVATGFIAGDVPFTGYSARAEVIVPWREHPFDDADRIQVRHVTPGYARAVGARVLRGRYLQADDRLGSTPVVVLNQEAVTRYFGGREPLGETITIGRGYAPHAVVVGIVANVRLGGPEGSIRPEAYLPAAQGRFLGGALAVRTRGDPLPFTDAVRGAVWATLPELGESEAETLSSILGGLVAQRRFTMIVVGLFGSLALVIAGTGLYGVMAYVVSQRTREIGVRVALGAMPARVMSTVLGRALALTVAGVAIGVSAAWPLAGSLERFLFEVPPHDPVVYIGAATLLAACGIAAALVPALRAARVDPVIALRAD